MRIGFNTIFVMKRIIAMLSLSQQSTKRLIHESSNKGMLIDATHARKARVAIVTDTEHIVETSISPEAIASRLVASRRSTAFKSSTDEAKNEL